MPLNAPNLLTGSRILAIPALVAAFYIPGARILQPRVPRAVDGQ
jgi:phosphatidylglycerophosphate synthase